MILGRFQYVLYLIVEPRKGLRSLLQTGTFPQWIKAS